MIAKELILTDIPMLKPSDSVGLALEWMDDFKLSHLPIVDNGIFKGIIDENALFNCEHIDHPLENMASDFAMAFVLEEEHVFEVVKKVADFKVSMIPVITTESKYSGGISLTLLMETIAEMPVVKNPGAIIVLEMSMNDYSLFEISRIIEENNAKILGSFITRFPESTKMELTIKLNKEEIQPILNSLERFNYTITASYHKSGQFDNITDRYNQLMKYLNI